MDQKKKQKIGFTKSMNQRQQLSKEFFFTTYQF